MGRRNRDRRERRPQRAKTVLHAHGEAGRGGSFRCAGCRLEVPVHAPGTAHRNHCPHCLTSLHVDLRIPGDRAADCRGPMAAVGLAGRADGEWMLVHRCARCGGLSGNRVAGDDNARALVRLAVRPLAGAPSGFASVAREALVRL
ncbi:RNHCP domain-containing protein [Nocardiopsis flavescens]|uniref:RNHCP domain-containing protein n=1 Tax=Nocardiopsis flavescens TaxID=758803 RepID=A0A1M6TZ64_9ACTN|nr:RNHCP domain-containing protein [Nocardiopsis flavescens]SHK62305.1 RNHCP domain-containing protein [Nocardiopsis flavescens]